MQVVFPPTFLSSKRPRNSHTFTSDIFLHFLSTIRNKTLLKDRMMERITGIKELQIEILRDLYNAEVLTVSELLYFKKQIHDGVLRELVHNYLYDSRAHITSLEEVLDELKATLMEEHCRTMKSIIQESKKLVERCEKGYLRDLAITTSLQRINTCKKSAYKALIALTGDDFKRQILHLLEDILDQESRMEEALAELTTEIKNLKQPAL